LSFAPLTLWWLQLLCMAAICQLVRINPERSGRIAWVFGLASFSAGLSWMFISMNRFGGMPAPLAAAAVVLLSAYLALYGALAIRLACRLTRSTQPAGHDLGFALVVAGLWGAGELGKGLLLTGFPWLSIGYAHVDGPFAGLAPWAGVASTC
jgi:apolipoprotein N-acyltransferase